MRKFLLASVTLLAFGAAANAADLSLLKAPAPAGYPAAGGFYFGLGASSTAASATVANTGIFAAGAGVDGVVGYQWHGGLDFIAAEADITYTNLGNSGACPMTASTVVSCSAGDQWEIEPLVKFGFPLSTVTKILPNLGGLFPALPALPSNLALGNSTQHPYVYVGAPVRDDSASYGLATGKEWLIQPEIGAGFLSQWQQGLVVDVRAGCTVGSTGFNLSLAGFTGPQSVKAGTSCQSRLEVLY